MNMGGYYKSFQAITDRMANARGYDVTVLYANACALYRDMLDCVEDIPDRDRPASSLHTLEYFEKWINTMQRWAMPVAGDDLASRNELANTANRSGSGSKFKD